MSGNDGKPSPRGSGSASDDSRFSIDSESSFPQEIPSITRLLDRKKLDPELAPGSPPPLARSQIRPSKRGGTQSPIERIQVWNEGAEVAPPPQSAQGLAEAWKQASGALWVVVLVPKGSDFQAYGIVGGDRSLWALWSGFRWGKTQAPQSFEMLSKNRMLGLTQGTNSPDAKALRAALTLDPLHQLYLVAAGENAAAPAFLMMSAVPGGDGANRAFKSLEARIKSSRL